MQQRFLLQILLLTQHVSGTTMPIIRTSRVLYSGCRLWYFVLWFSSCWSGVELRVMCPVCRMLQHLVGILFPHIFTHKLVLGCTELSANLTGSLKFLRMFPTVSSGKEVTNCVVFSNCSQRTSTFLSVAVSFLSISMSFAEKDLLFFFSPSNLTKMSQAPDCLQ